MGIHVAELWGDQPTASLLPEEQTFLVGAEPKRWDDFRRGRHCATVALGELGIARPVMLPGEQGEPRWPSGIVGSLTHCVGFAAAAVVERGEILSVGIDAEPNAPLTSQALHKVTSNAERSQLSGLARMHDDVHWDRLLFSCKESIYKAWFPMTKSWLGFADVELCLDIAGSFDAHLLAAPAPMSGPLQGRWNVHEGVLATSVVFGRGAKAV